ncbi:MAG TPA: endo alpha-1,4 polygalactosaminidase [Anaerolineales bacterium]|nr:endo alpha-1,4 polygalactosaminidase [Anaerolineales bacterium]
MKKIRHALYLLILVTAVSACGLPSLSSPTDTAPPPTDTPVPPTLTSIPPTNTPTQTLRPFCTPPPCAANESYYCEGDCIGGCGTVCATHTPVVFNWWQPSPGTTFHIQYDGEIDLELPVDVYNLDLFDTPAEDIQTLQARGVRVICYFSAGSWEDWRADAENFPPEVIGNPLEDWEGESWLDIRQQTALQPIMAARLDLAQEKGCDAVDPDNIDGYTNNTGFEISSTDQIAYNLWLAGEAHQRGLGVGLKNDLDQVPSLVNVFDFAVNEECYTYQECDRLMPFVWSDKAVFGIEYEADPRLFCPTADQDGFSFVLKNWELDEFAEPCWGE